MVKLEEIKNYLFKVDGEKKELGEKIAGQILDKGNSQQLGVLSRKERLMLFRWKSVNALFFHSEEITPEKIDMLIREYELMSKSESGLGLDKLTKLFSMEIKEEHNTNLLGGKI